LASAIAAGESHICALTTAGGVRCWGYNDHGQLGTGGTADRTSPPTKDAMVDAQAIATGWQFTCALTTAGGVRCWGYNVNGQLGDGTTTDRPTPATKDVLTGVQAIAAGGAHVCALTTTGGVRCWGDDLEGQLGDHRTNTNIANPSRSDVITGVKALAAGGRHTCALTTAGGVRCWGSNSAGQLGNGFRATPAPVLCQ
jgi:alpha-tubulin suppressor-like RCC1 family protein